MVDLVSRAPTDSRVLTRLDGIDTRLDRFESNVDARFERLDIRYEKLDGRIDNLESRFSVIEKNMVTKADLAQLYKHLLIGGVGLASMVIAAVTAVVTLF